MHNIYIHMYTYINIYCIYIYIHIDSLDVQVNLCEDVISWCKLEKRTFLRQRIEAKLANLLLQRRDTIAALKLGNIRILIYIYTCIYMYMYVYIYMYMNAYIYIYLYIYIFI
jgi:hypothetical protein